MIQATQSRVSPSIREAIRTAHRVRHQLDVPYNCPLDPFSAAEKLGIEVRLVDVPKLDGVCLHLHRPTILISSLRPLARQHFTCAHEIGHQVLGHRMSHADLTKDVASQVRVRSEDERQADAFAGLFLMPPIAVRAALTARKLRPEVLQPVSAYQLANHFGVGYATLVTHLAYGLNIFPRSQAERLLIEKLPSLRRQITGVSVSGYLVVLDVHSGLSPRDLHVGDYVYSPERLVVASSILNNEQQTSTGWLYQVHRPGVNEVAPSTNRWRSIVRASSPDFTGRAIFRHLEAEDDL